MSPGSAGKVRVRYIWPLATPPTSTLPAVDMPGILQWGAVTHVGTARVNFRLNGRYAETGTRGLPRDTWTQLSINADLRTPAEIPPPSRGPHGSYLSAAIQVQLCVSCVTPGFHDIHFRPGSTLCSKLFGSPLNTTLRQLDLHRSIIPAFLLRVRPQLPRR